MQINKGPHGKHTFPTKCDCGGDVIKSKHKSFSLLVGFHTDVNYRCQDCSTWFGHETRPFFDGGNKT